MRERAIHAVVVAFRVPEALDRCLAALRREIPVTVVDNSSCREIAAVAARHGAQYLDSGANLGFAAAVNRGLEAVAGCDVDVLLLNPDAVLSARGVHQLGLFLHEAANERVAAVAPRVFDPSGHEQRVSWPYPSPGRMCAEAIGLGRLPARGTFLTGAILLLRREAIEQVGSFDERFFLYAEEADWQRRAGQHGWVTAICTAVTADHTGGGTSRDSRTREALFHAAQEALVRKWHGTAGWQIYRTAACLGAAARAVIHTRDRRKAAVRRLFLYLRGPSRCVEARSR